MPSSSQLSQNPKKTFKNLLNDICQLVNETEKTDERSLEADEDALLLEWCKHISELNTDEFTEFDEQLCLHLIRDWTGTSCFRSLHFLTDVISYICLVADIQIVEEHLLWFSQPSMPPHVLLVVYPALLTVIANKRRPSEYLKDSDDTFRTNFEKLMFKLSQENSAQDVSKLAQDAEFINFWKDVLQHYKTCDSEEFDRKLLSAFLCYHPYFQFTFKDHNPRLEIMQLLFKGMKKKNKQENSLILCSLFLIFIKSTKIDSVTKWAAMKIFIKEIKSTASQQTNEKLKDLATTAIQIFTQYVDIFDESCLNELLMPPNNEDNSKSARNVNHTNSSSSTLKDVHVQKSQQNLNSDTKENESSKTILKTAVDQRPISEKFLDSLEKLVEKMQSSDFQFNTSAQKERLKHQIANLNQFL